MNKFLTIKQIQTEESKILFETINYLNKNNISYSLAGGTALGAIRHKGFIPWDDDIDIFISRPDYNKLQNLLKENNNISGNLYAHSYELKNLNLPFTKIYNYNIYYDDNMFYGKNEKYLWIDIFPIDGMPEDDNECMKLYKKNRRYKKLIFLKKQKLSTIFNNDKSRLYNCLRCVKKFLTYLLPTRYYVRKIIFLTKKYPYEKSSLVGNLVWGYGPQERMTKKESKTYIKTNFENIEVTMFKSYDKYLKNIYGNYMELPPQEKRITHSFKAWRKEDEK